MDRLNFETDGKDWPNRSASRLVAAAGFTWHVQILGHGPPCLLLHGTGASTHSWRQLVPLLAPHFRLIVPDLPGHGFTEFPPSDALSLPGMAKAVGDLMKALGVEPVVCAGHSAGAAVLIQMALDGFIKPTTIISVNGALLPFQGVAGQIFSPLAKLLFLNPLIPRVFAWRAADRGAVARLLRDTGSEPTTEDIEFYARLFSSPSHCAAALGMMARWDLYTFETRLRTLNVPLVLIAADNDKAIKPADAVRAAKIVPQGRVVTIPRAGHLVHEEQPQVVADVLLSEIPEPASPPPSTP
jgi:magnesium chelatase accessory protein